MANGTPRYRRGTTTTDKGFTGQYHDVSGLDSYHARYYDPVVGRFVSADTAQGNAQGMDPYSYVGNNPETKNDPTGQYYADHSGDIARPLPHAAWVNSAGCGKVPNCSVRGFDVENASQGEEHWAYQVFIGKQALPDLIIKQIARWGQGHQDPKVKSPYCESWCGNIKNQGKYWGAALEMGSSLVVVIAVIAAAASATASGGLGVFFANFLAGTGIQAFRNFIDGIQGMVDSFTDHNPFLDVVIDAAKVVLDIAGIFANLASFAGVLKTSGMKAAQGTLTLMFRVLAAGGQVLSGQGVGFKNAFGAGINTAQGFIGLVGSSTSLIGDVLQYNDDMVQYHQYMDDHVDA